MTLIDLDPGRHRAPGPAAEPMHLLSCARHPILPLCGADSTGRLAALDPADATCVDCLWRRKEGLACARWRCSGRPPLWHRGLVLDLLLCVTVLVSVVVWGGWLR